jgi:hypothetical protein
MLSQGFNKIKQFDIYLIYQWFSRNAHYQTFHFVYKINVQQNHHNKAIYSKNKYDHYNYMFA